MDTSDNGNLATEWDKFWDVLRRVESAVSLVTGRAGFGKPTRFDDLASDLKLGIGALRSAVSGPDAKKRWEADIGGLLSRSIVPTYPGAEHSLPYQLDAVVVHCIASGAGIAVASSVAEQAGKLFARRPADYLEVLGDCLPAGMRDGARRSARAAAYDRGGNPTALGDWDEFLVRHAADAERPAGHRIGLPTLDAELGGLQGLIILGGEPGRGKSALVQHMILAALAADPDLAVLHYSLDMPKQTVLSRLWAGAAGLSLRELRGPRTGEEEVRSAAAADRLKRDVLPRLAVHEWSDREAFDQATGLSAALDHRTVMRHREALLAAAKAKRIAVFIDYLQRLRIASTLAVPGGPVAGVADELVADLDRLHLLHRYRESTRSPTNPTGDAVVVVSEVRKGEGGRRELELGDIRGHTRIGYTADTVMVIQAAEGGPPAGAGVARLVLKVLKARDATHVAVPLAFRYLTYQFAEASNEPAPAAAAGSSEQSVAAGGRRRDPYAGRR